MIRTVLVYLFISGGLFGQDSLDLQRRIYQLYTSDQEFRTQLTKYYNGELDTALFDLEDIKRQIRRTDSTNYSELKSILDSYGFPGYRLVGEDYSNSFWNVVQHQDENVEIQKLALLKMKAEVDRGNASGLYYAYLVDRVKVNLDEPQVYGTQMRLNADSTSYEPNPVIDPGHLDERRKEVGLPPVSEYIGIMNERYSGTLKKKGRNSYKYLSFAQMFLPSFVRSKSKSSNLGRENPLW